MCRNTPLGYTPSCRNCAWILRADGFRCYASIEFGTGIGDRDSFHTVGCRCREPRITAPRLKQSWDNLWLLARREKQSDGASEQKHGASLCRNSSGRGCYLCIVETLQLTTVTAFLPFSPASAIATPESFARCPCHKATRNLCQIPGTHVCGTRSRALSRNSVTHRRQSFQGPNA